MKLTNSKFNKITHISYSILFSLKQWKVTQIKKTNEIKKVKLFKYTYNQFCPIFCVVISCVLQWNEDEENEKMNVKKWTIYLDLIKKYIT